MQGIDDRTMGATALSQYRVRVAPGHSPVRSCPGSDVVLFGLRGEAFGVTARGREDEVGSTEVTRFIGSIPRSKAPAHDHHDEEALTILSGPGSVIVLPVRQAHSLECTVPEGLRLVGHFDPAGNPAVHDTP